MRIRDREALRPHSNAANRLWRALAGAAALAMLPALAVAQAPQAPLEIIPVPADPMPDGFTFAAVGDIIYLRAMLPTMENNAADMLRLIREADVAYGNFETMAFDLTTFDGYPAAQSGGTWMLAEPETVAEVAAMGFDIVSTANNHSTDWGNEGLFATEALLREAGLTFSGTGRNLQAARAARYHDMRLGRVALISAASTFTPMSRAADPLGEVPGRPGLNPLRVERIAQVTPEHLATLAEIAATVPFTTPPAPAADGSIRLLGTRYRAGPQDDGRMSYSYEMNQRDLAGNLLAIRQGRQNSNFAVFSMHNHEPSNSSEIPPDFVRDLARRTIDAGADAYVGHGPHILRGIEIYRGKPIFYSLANFAMMNNSLDAVPADMYEQYGVEPGSATVPEMLQARGARVFSDPRLYESVIAISRYVGGRVAEIRLYPIDLGVDIQGAARGVPRMAGPEVGRRILERMQRLSEPFGTRITIERGVGVIRIPAS